MEMMGGTAVAKAARMR